MEKNDQFLNQNEGFSQKDDFNYSQKSQPNKFSKPFIAGILLLVAGTLGILNWVQLYTIDTATINSVIDISQLSDMGTTITPEGLVSFIRSCSIIGIIISIFTILGGILSLKRKLWGIVLTCSIIGIGSVGLLFSSSLLSFIAMILLIVSRKGY